MRTALLTFFTIALLGTALAASALGAIDSPGSAATVDAIGGNVAAERQVDGTEHAAPPLVLLPPTSGQPPVTVVAPPTSGQPPVTVVAPPTSGQVPATVLLPPTSGQAPVIVRLPTTSTAPSSVLLGVFVAGAGMASGLTLLVMGRRRR